MERKNWKVTLEQIAEFVKGEVEGDPALIITGVSPLETAVEGDLSFVAHSKYLKHLSSTKASALLVKPDFPAYGKTVLRVENPQYSFLQVVKQFFCSNEHFQAGVHPTAVIGSDVTFGTGVAIGAYVVVGDHTCIGDNTILHPGVVVEHHTKIGNNTTIHAGVFIGSKTEIGHQVTVFMGTVIGSDGFGFVRQNGQYYKMPHLGTVVIEDEVEIGANCTIDRATFGATKIGRGTKLDNMVHIAHNVEIGENTVIAAQTAIAGSTKIGKNVIVGGQVGFAEHLEIGDHVTFGARSGVTKSFPSNVVVSGFPAGSHAKAKKQEAALRLLPKLFKRIRQLEKEIKALKQRG